MLAIRKAEILQGRFNVKARRRGVLFKELAYHYLEYSRATKRSYTRDITSTKHLLSYFGNRPLNSINQHL